MQEKQIGEHTYEVSKLPSKKSLRAFWLTGNALQHSLKAFGDLQVGDASNVDVGSSWEGLVGAVSGFFRDEASLESFEKAMDMLATVTYLKNSDGKRSKLSGVFDAHFASHQDEMVAWFIFAAEVNFKGFISGPGGAWLELLGTLTSSTQTSQKASTGSRGESSSASDLV